MDELTLKDAIQELEELSTGDWVPYEYSPEEAKLILNHINNLQSKIDKVNEVLNQPMPTHASCVKALDEIEFILKEDK